MSYFLSLTVLGIVAGATYAISASGLVLTYTTTGVFNIAQGAVGMICAFTLWSLNNTTVQHLPLWLAVALVVLVEAPLMGLAIEFVFMRRLHGASTERALMVTLGLLLILLGLAQGIWTSGQTSIYMLNDFLPNVAVHVPGAGVTLTGEQLVTVGAAVVVGLGLWVLLRYVRLGVAMRAVVDDPELVALSGARPLRLAQMGWVVGCMTAAVAGILLGQAAGSLDPVTLTLVVINSFAAAVVGRLRSLPWTLVGALVLGLFDNYVIGYAHWSWIDNAELVLPMVFLFVVLLALPQDRLRAAAGLLRDVPQRVPSRPAAWTGAAVVVAAAALLANVTHGNLFLTLSGGMVLGIAALSLVLLSGYGGQVSLCQMTFVGIGAVTMGKVAGGGSWLGVLAAVGISAGFGALVALPTVRLRGLYLALGTLAFAQMATYVYFVPEVDTAGGVFVHRLHVPLLGLSTPTGQVLLYAVLFALAALAVLAVRRGRAGRRLVALADSPAGAATVGLDGRLGRLVVFTVSAGLAGLAGALTSGTFVTSMNFTVFISLELMLLLVIWGSRSVTGALLAGLSLAALNQLTTGTGWSSQIPFLLVGAGIIAIGRVPHGVLEWAADVVGAPWARRRARTGPDDATAPIGMAEQAA